MFTDVSNALKITGHYNDDEIELFQTEVKERILLKDEILLHQGEVAKSAYFLGEGAVYQCLSESSINHCNIIDLHLKNEWFLNAESFISQRPSNYQVVAFTQSTILELSIESIHYLTRKSASFLQLNRVLTGISSRAYLFDHMLTPLQKYQFIMENKRDLIQAFPLKIIASYLKVTPETLSRVRNKLVKNNS